MLRSVWTVRINSNGVNVLNATLDFLENQGVLPTAQILFERFSMVKFESFVTHKLQGFRKRFIFACKFEIVHINTKYNLFVKVEI